MEHGHKVGLYPFKLPKRHCFRSARHLKLEWSLIFAIRVKSNAIDFIRETQRRMRFSLNISILTARVVFPSLLHIFGMRACRNNTTGTILPDYPNLNRRKGQGTSHLVGTTFDFKRVALFGSRNERSMYVCRNTRFLKAVSRDRQTSGPVDQAGGHGTV